MASSESAVIHKGLDNIYVCESKICYIDGENSQLYYRGYSIEELTNSSNFEEVSYLLINGELPTKAQLELFKTELRNSYSIPAPIVEWMRGLPKSALPMDAIRSGVSMLSLYDANPSDNSLESNKKRSYRILGAMPALLATFSRLRRGLEPVEPKKNLSLASNFLYMLKESAPDEYDVSVMDKTMILHAEHEMNASTFSCVVTASTLSDMYSAITAGIATLKGPLHGGANEASLKFIQSVGSPEKAEEAVERVLRAKQRIMGFGHRVYKNFDPRYKILRKIAEKMVDRKPDSKQLLLTAEAVEQAALKRLSNSKIFPNVDFYSGTVFNALGVETDLFTPVFAMSRTPGWAAHALEYLEDNRLVRPKAYYTGTVGKKYVPLEERGDSAAAR
jgi:citrate synthase